MIALYLHTPLTITNSKQKNFDTDHKVYRFFFRIQTFSVEMISPSFVYNIILLKDIFARSLMKFSNYNPSIMTKFKCAYC